MKKLITLAFSLCIGMVNAENCEALKSTYNLNEEQEEIMYRSFQAGLDHDLGYSLAAVAFHESRAGLYLENPSDPSGGVFHILLSHVLKKFDMENNKENREMALDMLVSNFDFAAAMAIQELEYWAGRHNGQMFNTWRSYNGGHYWLSKSEQAKGRSLTYANNVSGMVSFLQQNCSHWEDS